MYNIIITKKEEEEADRGERGMEEGKGRMRKKRRRGKQS